MNSIATTPGAERNNDTSVLTPQGHTLFEEFSKRLSFSSTNKRHTDRDISLFIIEQRLKNLNELARLNRSASEPDVSIDIGTIEKRISDRATAKSSPPATDSQVDAAPAPPPKRRKLFNPSAYDEQVAMQSTDSSDNNNEATATDKLIRTQNAKISNTTAQMKRLKQRRSSMDFRKEPPKPVKVYASIMKSSSSMNYLAYTTMNQDQINVINKV